MAPADGVQPAHHIFAIVLADGVDRTAFREALRDEGVQTSVHYPPAHRFSIHSDDAPPLPLTDAYAATTVTLPLFAHMSLPQQDRVIAAVTASQA